MALIVGISAFYHDSAVAITKDGKIIAAAQEERFTRIKHDANFPINALKWALDHAKITLADVDGVAFYDKPLLKFERLLETYIQNAPFGFSSFRRAMPVWLKDKLFQKPKLRQILKNIDPKFNAPLFFTEHHESHAASAFYPSPYERAAVLCLDGVGEFATTSLWHGDGAKLEPKWQINYPHSLGLLYSAFTYFCGFKVNSGEYKLMGLAPYGEPKFVKIIKDNLININDDGTFTLNMKYFGYSKGMTMTNNAFAKLFGVPARKGESQIEQVYMDIARSIQVVTEEVVLKLCYKAYDELKIPNLCLAGGVALNCVANGKIKTQTPFENVWIQPAAGDAGGALGAALTIEHQYFSGRRVVNKPDSMQGSYLGPNYDGDGIQQFLKTLNIIHPSNTDVVHTTAKLLSQNKVIGWFQGAMEFGPRALGGRSILGNPMSPAMQRVMNLKIKYRESFRPFAPIVKEEEVDKWFDFNGTSPYMLMVAPVHPNKLLRTDKANGFDRLNQMRSVIPAVTHVDNSARLQTVNKHTNPKLWALLDEFEKITGCPILINTSFNVRGEPIVMSPEDAYRCFRRTEMDYLVLEDQILSAASHEKIKDQEWQKEFELD